MSTADRPPERRSWPAEPSALSLAELAPAPGPRSIHRPALERVFEQASAARLSVVCAGPGWGKTTAAARWLVGRPAGAAPVAWVTLGPHVADPASFWNAVIDAIGEAVTVPEDHPLAHLSLAAGVSDEVLASIWQALAVLPGDVVLVLEDFQELTDPVVVAWVGRLAALGGPIRVMVLTRVVPDLPRHRLRLAGQLAEITAQDLALTADEIRRLAAMESLILTETQARTLLTRTEGWPAGVRLALMHATRHGVDALDSFGGTDQPVADYLLAEVLDRNKPEVRDFLLRTAVAQPVSADLAAALVPGAPAQQILEGLEARNEFVTSVGPDRAWFRYHGLLRDLLEHVFHRDDPDALRQSHRRAAVWWAVHGSPLQALTHATAAGEVDLVGEIYTRAAAPGLVGAHRDTLRACLLHAIGESAAPSVVEQLQRAGVALVEGRAAAVGRYGDVARDLVARGEPADPSTLILLELLSVAAHRFDGDPTAIRESAARALAMLDRADRFPAWAGYRAIATQSHAVGLLWSGDLEPAARILDRLLASADRTPLDGVELAMLAARSNVALAHALRGQLDLAGELAGVAVEYATARGWAALLQTRPAHLTRALVHLVRGEGTATDVALADAHAAVSGGEEQAPALWLWCLQTEAAAARGRTRAAGHALARVLAGAKDWDPVGFLPDAVERALTAARLTAPRGLGAPLTGVPGTHTSTGLSCRGRLLLRDGKHLQALALVAPVREIAEPESLLDLLAVLDAQVVAALAEQRDQRTSAALATLRAAIALAGPQRVAAPFLGVRAPELPALLRQLRDEDPEDPFVGGLCDQLRAGGSPPREGEPLLEPLTERELAVLRALPSMKSNAEIAADSFVSVNTVKAHLKSLYRKLGVSRRREAVERARELGLMG